VAERVGRRTRTGYHITPAGLAALGAWLATAPAAPAIEIEALLPLLHADHGSADELRTALETSRHQALQLLDAGRAQVEGHLRDGGPFPQRAPAVSARGA
jgi:DNA-binding PadR family transcriptional regulator